MKVYLARHGQTNYNELQLCNADSSVDVHLTRLGIKQAGKLAESLKNVPLEAVYVSELHRTKQTAEIISKHHKIALTVDSRLHDNRTGYEGKPVKDYLDALYKAKDMWTVRLNDGESIEDVKQRVSSFIEDLKNKKYETVLIVTSQMVIQCFNAIVNHLSNEKSWGFDIDQGSYTELEL
jgi:probable phosphoglycerate mutase